MIVGSAVAVANLPAIGKAHSFVSQLLFHYQTMMVQADQLHCLTRSSNFRRADGKQNNSRSYNKGITEC